MQKIQCFQCKNNFIPNKDHKYDHKTRGMRRSFCTQKCYRAAQDSRTIISCANCGNKKSITASDRRQSKSGRSFCNKSCAATYNNKLKRKVRRSKCEIALFQMLTDAFPKITVLPNNKTMLDGYEVDIAVPSIKLAIEWNGIVHFKPIYGQMKLNKIQQRDAEKQKIASNKGINLIIISDLVSTQTRVNEAFVEIQKIIKQLTI